MSYKPQRTFNGTQGNPSTDTMGPEQLSHDIDELCKMFNPNSVHSGGEEGGVSPENLNFDINDIDGVESTDIKSIRVKTNGDLEYTTDGTTYHPAFAREDNYLAKAGGTMTGDIAMGGNKVTGLGTPSADTDAAPKKYVDETAASTVNDKFFVAMYGATTYAEVLSAYNAEKLIYATSSGVDGFIPLMMFDSANNRFLFSFNGQYSLSVFMLSQSNGWSLVSADVAPIASPNFRGAPTTPDLTSSSGGTQIANKAYVDAVIPSQSGQSGKYLSTNGFNVKWETISSQLPSQSGNNGKFLTTNGSAASWSDTPMVKGIDYVTAGTKAGTITASNATAEGYNNTATAASAHAEGHSTVATGLFAHAEGEETTASGQSAHAEGYGTIANSTDAHAEGYSTTAINFGAHAEGGQTHAAGMYSHAEGDGTSANAHASHAEGVGTSAVGQNSHAEGTGTITSHRSQHVFGEYNVRDQHPASSGDRGTTIEIVGNGSDDAHRSNARTLDWFGNETLAGKLTVGTGPTNNMDVTTKQYVDGELANKQAKITASGILKGDGTGGVTAAVSGTDYDVPELPSQSGQSGKFLTTDGTSVSWGSVGSGLPSQTGHGGEFLTTNGASASWTDTPMVKGVDYVTAGKKANTTLDPQATAEGFDTTASGACAHAEGRDTVASGNYSHAEGSGATASGNYSHAEGLITVASGHYSHAEGHETIAGGHYSHAEGDATEASGVYSHAEGFLTGAYGTTSHAEGWDTTANHRSQHVFGEFNAVDTNPAAEHQKGTYVEIVGNGTAANARSNARTLDWSGNETLAGKLTVGVAPTNDMDVATKQYVDTAISSAEELPSQSGHSGEFLTTNGSAVSWAAVDALPSQSGQNGKFLTTNGTTASWAEVGGGSVTELMWIEAKFDSTRREYYIDESLTDINNALAAGKLPVIFDGLRGEQHIYVYASNSYGPLLFVRGEEYVFPGGDPFLYLAGVNVEEVGGESVLTFFETMYATMDQLVLYQDKITASGMLKGSGSGLVTAAVAGVDYQAPLPSQSGNSGKFLTTNGSAMSWASISVPTKVSDLTNDSGYLTLATLPIYDGTVV